MGQRQRAASTTPGRAEPPPGRPAARRGFLPSASCAPFQENSPTFLARNFSGKQPERAPPVQRLDFLFQCGPTLLKPHTSAPGGALGAHPTPRNEGPPRNTHVPRQQHGRSGIKKSIVSKRGFRTQGAGMPEHVWVPSQRAGDAALKPSLRPALPSPSSALQKTFFTLKLRIKLWSSSCVSHTST